MRSADGLSVRWSFEQFADIRNDLERIIERAREHVSDTVGRRADHRRSGRGARTPRVRAAGAGIRRAHGHEWTRALVCSYARRSSPALRIDPLASIVHSHVDPIVVTAQQGASPRWPLRAAKSRVGQSPTIAPERRERDVRAQRGGIAAPVERASVKADHDRCAEQRTTSIGRVSLLAPAQDRECCMVPIDMPH